MLRKVLFGVFFILVTASYSQVGNVLFSESRLVPHVLNYQGYLTDTLGIPIDDSLDMTFKIFDAATVGNQLWSETQTDVPVERGIFSVLLGSGTAIPDTVFTKGTDRWLELTLEGTQTLSPRTRITAMGYAYTSTYSDTAEYAKNAAADNDWIRGTPDSVLFTANYVGIARGGADNLLYGDNVHTHTNLGVACATGSTGFNHQYCTVAGGQGNIAGGDYATVGGGHNNTADNSSATVSGGNSNTADGFRATVGGGHNNTANGSYATVAGGSNNTADTALATVGGGYHSIASGSYAFVGGGHTNTASGYYATVAGGMNNIADTVSATIGGGNYNTASGLRATIGGGYNNTASGNYAFAGGGDKNTANGSYATVGGGYFNTASGYRATIGGGFSNHVEGDYSAILGGYADTIAATAAYSYLCGINSNLSEDSTFMVDMPHIRFGDETSGYDFPVSDGANGQVMMTDGSGQLSWTGVPADTDWVISSGDMYSGVSGDVGVGTTSPGEKLDVNGTVKMTGFNMPTSPTNGYVLTSDASGIGTWQPTGSDNDWVRETPDSVLFTVNNLGISRGNAGNMLYGDSVYTHVTLGVACTTGLPGQDYSYCTVSGGYNNYASRYATVGGGYNNMANDFAATVSGGRNNTSSWNATVGGGYYNTASNSYATVGGGLRNIASGEHATVAGGYGDTCLADNGFAANSYSRVRAAHTHSAAFNGQTTTGSSQLRCDELVNNAAACAIDHPLDPEGKILNHYTVASTEMLFTYRGVAYISENGQIEVRLPDFFEACNKNAMIQLTGVGTSDVFVAEDISGNRFVIGGQPGTKVYWTVTGERKDQPAEIARVLIPVEQQKTGDLYGHSIDDDYLFSAMDQLEQMGRAAEFQFRTARGQARYENSKRQVMENR